MDSSRTDDILGQYSRLAADDRVTPIHLSVYMSLICLWHTHGYADAIIVTRKRIMKLAHISSIATYHKCIRQLVDYGYIIYQPSYNYYKKTTIALTGRS